ncbi:hypothetical protein HK102_011396, partial [Quaeritorhiza haematococci]
MLDICAEHAYKHRSSIKSLEKSITEVTERVAETKTQSAALEGERRNVGKQMLAVMEEISELQQKLAKLRERLSEFDEQTKMMERTISEYKSLVMTKKAEIKDRQKILEEVNLFHDQVWEMMCGDPKAPLPPVPDFDRLPPTEIFGSELDTE